MRSRKLISTRIRFRHRRRRRESSVRRATPNPLPRAPPTSPTTNPRRNLVKPDHPANIIPYTVRPGDSVGAIAQMFGITAEELAHANRIHVDEELQVDEVLKVPHPFTTEVNTLKSQVETLSAQQQAAEQKSDSAEEQLKSLQSPDAGTDRRQPGAAARHEAAAMVARDRGQPGNLRADHVRRDAADDCSNGGGCGAGSWRWPR